MTTDYPGVSALQGHDSPQTIDPGEERLQRVLHQFHTFPFSSDGAFQQGLSGILSHESTSLTSDDDRSDLVLKTKVFYFNRITGLHISLEDVQGGYPTESNHTPTQSGDERNQTSGPEHEETHVLTFSELKSLIEQGKTDDIPNNKTIPDALNDSVPSESITPLRRKPWEVASES